MSRLNKIFLSGLICITFCSTMFIMTFQMFKRAYINTAIYNGQLKVNGTSIINQFGEEIMLRGLSTNGIQWSKSDCIDNDTLKYLNKKWNVNVFRIAVYTEENGYIENKSKIYDKTIDLIEKCIEAKIYVIVDWHINKDGNPNKYKEEAKEFFEKVSSKYGKSNSIIYEICNEPNGVSWVNDIVPYANDIIPVIRKNSPKSIIIVGTPNYSRDVSAVVNRQLEFDNILYSFHFYSATHKGNEMDDIKYAISQGVPVIVSEWGTSEYTGDGKNDFEEADKWLNFLEKNNISWINWSYSYGEETSSILKNNIINNIELIDDDLTEAGKYVRNRLLK